MKKVFFIIFLLFGVIILLRAQDAASIMTQSMKLFQEGNYPEMAKLIENNKQHLEKSEMYASFLYILGFAYTCMGDYPKAETTYLEEKTIHEKTFGKEHSSYLNALINLGNIYREMGDYARAETCYLETKTIREKVSGRDHSGYASSVNSLANLYHAMGDYVQAETSYREAIAIQEKVLGKENITYTTTLNNLAATYCAMGEYAKAETWYRDAIAILTIVLGKEHPNYAFSLGNLGTVYRYWGNYDKAETFYRDAKIIQERVLGKQHPAYAISINNLGGLYKDMGDDTKAESCYQEEKSIWEKGFGRKHPNHVRSLNDLGGLYLTTKNYAKAEAVKTEADQIVTEQIENNFTILSERQRALFWDKNKHHFEQTYSYAHANQGNSMIAHTYDNTLFEKGLLLRTVNGIRDAIYSSGDHDVIGKYELLGSIRQTISALQSRDTPDSRMIGTLESRADSLDKTLTIASVAYKDLKEDISTKWQGVRDVLQTGEAAVEFVHFRFYDGKGFTDKTFYCAMVLKKGAVAPVWIPLCDENQLRTLTRRVTYNIQKQTQGLYSGVKGDSLYHLIWQPLEKELQDVRTVYYSPSGILHQLAFAAIPVGTELLSDKYDLQLVSSTREIARLKKEKTGTLPKGTVAVYGGLYYDADRDQLIAESRNANPSQTPPKETTIVAVFPKNIQRGGSWGFLEGTENEAEQICQYLNEQKIPNRLFSETAGNEESFKRMSGTSVGIIHLATHGFFLEDVDNEYSRDIVRQLGGGSEKAFENPLLRSGLLLAGANRAWTGEDVIEGIEDGILTADEISQMNLIKTGLVVLSACETGLGELRGSEGVFGLQRAFKLAGVETLVMSLWTVPDEATAELMADFYKLWLSGKTKSEAFATAQRQVREKYKEPFFWAGFVMMD